MSDRSGVHLIGIAGSGMLPLALLLHEAGHRVSGSDEAPAAAALDLLRQRGVEVTRGAGIGLPTGCERVVVSPAIPRFHPELRAARRAGLPVQIRAEALAALLGPREIVCVAGSHGKSTTTAMLAHIVATARGDAVGYMLGAAPAGGATAPARLGRTDAPFVMEACEAHGALAHWRPAHAILTNADDDHAAHYGGVEHLAAAFAAFLRRIPPGGAVVACGDDPGIRALLRGTGRAALTYGLEEGNRLRVADLPGRAARLFLDGRELGILSLSVPGAHNRLNAMAALAMALHLGIDAGIALGALSTFRGVARRLQRVDGGAGPRVLDDFAHHPAEIAASLRAAREGFEGRLIAVLEPQLHSRVTDMADAFVQALALADRRFLLPVAALGEAAGNRDGNAALAAASARRDVPCEPVAGLPDLIEVLRRDVRTGDTLVVMAGRTGDGLAGDLAAALDRPAIPASPAILHGHRRPPERDLLSVVAARMAADPAAPAVTMGHRRLTYGDLAARSADLEAALRAAGIQAQDSVGVLLNRTVDRVVAFLAVLRLGAVFVPLDPAQPAERLSLILADCRAELVIVNPASPALPDERLRFVNCAALPERPVAPADLAPPAVAPPEALAYMIFTSGTTGCPKGVEVCRGGLSNYAGAVVRHFGIGPGSRVSQVSAFGFDVSVGDMAMALAAGACLVYPTDNQAQAGGPLGRFVAETRLTHLSLTPSALGVVPAGAYPDLTHVIVAGEPCPPALVERWGGGRTFVNAYGPTEATVEATFALCEPGAPVTIGRPIDNMGACLLDGELRLVPPGGEGELCLFGPGLARGYRNLPDLTAARFPLVELPGIGAVRLYRTGDRATVGPGGELVYRGRLDEQVKYHGYRIEPAEIEAVLSSFPGILDAAVSLAPGPAGDRLIAHLVPDPHMRPIDMARLRRQLRDRLPAYMVPSLFLPVREIPLTASGKRDRGALPLPPRVLTPPGTRTAGTPTEERLMALVAAQAGDAVVAGTRDSLIAAGFDSLALATLLLAVEETFGLTVDIAFGDGLDTVEAMALAIDARAGHPRALAARDGSADVAAIMRPYLATWPGERLGGLGLVRSLSSAGAAPPLFWCFQGGEELARLTEALAGGVRLFGLRSGHLAMTYSRENLDALARSYADEIESVTPRGSLIIGGNCQGGMVMREVGIELRRRGRDISLTVLMEQGRFLPCPGSVLLLFGERSYFNPYGQLDAPERIFRLAYPDGHRVEVIPGGHGEYFSPENVTGLAHAILRHVEWGTGEASLSVP